MLTVGSEVCLYQTERHWQKTAVWTDRQDHIISGFPAPRDQALNALNAASLDELVHRQSGC